MAADTQNQDEEFDGFENLDENFDPAAEDTALDDPALDAEFQDMEDALGDDVFAEEAIAPAAKPKKKVNWFNIIIALVAVAGAGGLVLSKLAPQLLSGGVPEMAAPVVAGPDAGPANAEAAAQAAVATPPGGAPVQQGGMLDNPDAFAELTQNAPAPERNAIPDPFAGLEQNNQPAAPVPAGEVLPDVPMPAPITSSMPEPTAERPVPAPVIEAAPVVPVAAEPVVVAADTAVSEALKGQVDTLSSRMDTIESKLDEALNNAALNKTVAAPADDSRFDAIQQTLARLESRLDDMSKQRAAPVRSASVDDEDRPAPVKKTPKKSTPAKAKQSGGQWDEPYKASAGQTTPMGATGAATGNPGGWVLRGAQPGQAIIGAAGGDIRQVSLGDSIPGIGQVTGIAPINGRWVVQGTQGRISQ